MQAATQITTAMTPGSMRDALALMLGTGADVFIAAAGTTAPLRTASTPTGIFYESKLETLFSVFCPLYFHLQLCQRASDAASSLSRLWKQSATAKLQQQNLARKVNNKLATLLKQSAQQTLALEEVLREATPLCWDLRERGLQYGHQVVDAVMEAKPVPTMARLVALLQLQPEMLGLQAWDDEDDEEVAAACMSSSSSNVAVSYGRLWLISVMGEHYNTS
jgi:hypothetical protein